MESILYFERNYLSEVIFINWNCSTNQGYVYKWYNLIIMFFIKTLVHKGYDLVTIIPIILTIFKFASKWPFHQGVSSLYTDFNWVCYLKLCIRLLFLFLSMSVILHYFLPVHYCLPDCHSTFYHTLFCFNVTCNFCVLLNCDLSITYW